MVQEAPDAAEVMRAFADFIGDKPLVAHTASFDRRFLNTISRRVYPDAPNHKLETLVRYKALQTDGTFHRALADAEMTAYLWMCMAEDLRSMYGFELVPFVLMRNLAKVPKAQVGAYLLRLLNA